MRGIMLALWCLGLGLPLANAAYLPITGPSDLRFQPVHAPVVITPPPLPVPQPPKAEIDPTPITPIPVTHPSTNVEDINLEAKSPPELENNGSYEHQGYFNSGSDALITPQMMVPFFQNNLPGTNAPSKPMSPIWFKPPMPANGSKSPKP
jgi:hypothetical protein